VPDDTLWGSGQWIDAVTDAVQSIRQRFQFAAMSAERHPDQENKACHDFLEASLDRVNDMFTFLKRERGNMATGRRSYSSFNSARKTFENAYTALQQLEVNGGNGDLTGEDSVMLANGILSALEGEPLESEAALTALIDSLELIASGEFYTSDPWEFAAQCAAALDTYPAELHGIH
jgi:hypothetical protein